MMHTIDYLRANRSSGDGRKKIELCSGLLYASLFCLGSSVSAGDFGFRLVALSSAPNDCASTHTITAEVGEGWVAIEHFSEKHLLFSDRSTTIEYFDEFSILSGCTEQRAWQKYSDYIPAQKHVVATGATCTYSNLGTVIFSFKLAFYDIVQGDNIFNPKLVFADRAQVYSGQYDKIDLGPIGFGQISYPTGKVCLSVHVE